MKRKYLKDQNGNTVFLLGFPIVISESQTMKEGDIIVGEWIVGEPPEININEEDNT